jgi:soluble lytic murein transglycosylase-like protein
MKSFFISALCSFLFVMFALHLPLLAPAQSIVTPVPAQAVIVAKVLPKLKPILTEQQQITKTATAVSRLYKTLSVPDAKQVVKLAFTYAKKNGIDPYLIVGLIAAESSFRKDVVSHMGAGGFMQVMEIYHGDKIKGRDVFDPHVNIQVGVKILANCFKKHKTNQRALGCYNGVRSVKGIAKYHAKVIKSKERIKRLVV